MYKIFCYNLLKFLSNILHVDIAISDALCIVLYLLLRIALYIVLCVVFVCSIVYLTDSASSEEQVRAIIRKYSLLDTPERREVSVKDMRRVIPQLIMCLFSKEDHHARKGM